MIEIKDDSSNLCTFEKHSEIKITSKVPVIEPKRRGRSGRSASRGRKNNTLNLRKQNGNSNSKEPIVNNKKPNNLNKSMDKKLDDEKETTGIQLTSKDKKIPNTRL